MTISILADNAGQAAAKIRKPELLLVSWSKWTSKSWIIGNLSAMAPHIGMVHAMGKEHLDALFGGIYNKDSKKMKYH